MLVIIKKRHKCYWECMFQKTLEITTLGIGKQLKDFKLKE